MIKSDIVFNVTSLQFDGDSIIHKGTFATPGTEFKEGDTVKLVIDKKKRLLNARAHSAGHLIDVCFYKLGFTNEGTKGCHFPDTPSVDFAGKLSTEEREKLKVELPKKINKMIKEATESDTVKVENYSYEEAGKALGEIPSYIKPGSSVRVVKVNSHDKGCPCGGTHVKHIKEIGTVKIEKIKNSGSKGFRISYQITDSP